MYTIGVAAELVGVHQETLRIWERNEIIKPARRNKQRLYSNNDIKRLRFIKPLLDDKGLNIAGVKQMINFYPCWWKENCKGGRAEGTDKYINRAKPCWKEENTYCFTTMDKTDYCQDCPQCARCPEDCKGS